jgi:hypothetical protein
MVKEVRIKSFGRPLLTPPSPNGYAVRSSISIKLNTFCSKMKMTSHSCAALPD